MDESFHCRAYTTVVLGCNNFEDNVKVSLLQHVIQEKDVLEMITGSGNVKLRETLRQHFLKEIKQIVTPKEMLDVCDSAGISQKGYRAMYKSITLGLRAKGVTQSLLPTLYSLQMAKRCANGDIASMFNGYRSVVDIMPMPPSKPFEYNAYNNVYIDMEVLQKAMIQYYGLTVEETGGNVVFVFKLDECQVVKGQRLERIGLTLMSRALKGKPLESQDLDASQENNSNSQGSQQDYYGIQSEKNIWWQAEWVLPKENYDTLRWYFEHSGIQHVISCQVNGQTLDVPGAGCFNIEWHLGGNLKTIKCMLGCKHGANALFSCVYCCHSKTAVGSRGKSKQASKSKCLKQVGARSTATNINAQKGTGSKIWHNGILSCDLSKPPSRDQEDNAWNPILDIPLCQVHVCTLHARLRILDKLLMLHINYAWNMEPED